MQTITIPQEIIAILITLLSAVQGIGLTRIIDALKNHFNLNGRQVQLVAGALSAVVALLTILVGYGITGDPEIWNNIHMAIAAIFGMSQVEYFSFWKKISPPALPEPVEGRN